MLRVPTNQATPGMRLAIPVLHPLRGTMLLAEGFVLDEIVIRRLCEMEIHTLWIEYPDTEQIKQYVSPTILQQQSQLVGTVADMFDAVHRDAHASADFTSYRRTIQGLIECLVTDPTAASYIVELGGQAGSELRHASEVCFLSILLGLKLQGYLIQQRKRLHPRDARDVISLGLGAMLHDIGKVALAQDVRDRYERTRDESDPQWRGHVVLGHKLVTGTIAPSAAGVVLHHHQYYDGSGFPAAGAKDDPTRGLAGEQIHVFARIVCVANAFDRLRRPATGKPMPHIRVLNTMLNSPLASRFDPVVLAALPLVAPAFPPGSVVTLNTGDQAAVVEWHPEAPCQPTVQLLHSPPLPNPPREQPNRPIRYDLRKHPGLRIVEHEGEDVSRDHFRLIAGGPGGEKSAA